MDWWDHEDGPRCYTQRTCHAVSQTFHARRLSVSWLGDVICVAWPLKVYGGDFPLWCGRSETIGIVTGEMRGHRELNTRDDPP